MKELTEERVKARTVMSSHSEPKDYNHCNRASDGQHVVDRQSANSVEDRSGGREDVLVDFACTLCGQTGVARVPLTDIAWD